MSTPIGFTKTDVLEDRRTLPTEEGDHERFSHYVEKDKLTEAMVMGTPVVALCGKVWVPSRAPEKFPVCPECKEVWESLKDDAGGSADSVGPASAESPASSLRDSQTSSRWRRLARGRPRSPCRWRRS